MRSDHLHLTAYQIGCEVGQYVVLVLRPAILDHDILALDVKLLYSDRRLRSKSSPAATILIRKR